MLMDLVQLSSSYLLRLFDSGGWRSDMTSFIGVTGIVQLTGLSAAPIAELLPASPPTVVHPVVPLQIWSPPYQVYQQQD